MTLTRSQLAALPKDDLKKVFLDAAAELNQKGTQSPNKRKPRLAFYNLVLAEVARRQR